MQSEFWSECRPSAPREKCPSSKRRSDHPSLSRAGLHCQLQESARQSSSAHVQSTWQTGKSWTIDDTVNQQPSVGLLEALQTSRNIIIAMSITLLAALSMELDVDHLLGICGIEYSITCTAVFLLIVLDLMESPCNDWNCLLWIVFPIVVVPSPVHANKTIVFIANFVAIIPLAAVLSILTEKLTMYIGEKFGGVINHLFGNVVVLIVAWTSLLTKALHHFLPDALIKAITNFLFFRSTATIPTSKDDSYLEYPSLRHRETEHIYATVGSRTRSHRDRSEAKYLQWRNSRFKRQAYVDQLQAEMERQHADLQRLLADLERSRAELERFRAKLEDFSPYTYQPVGGFDMPLSRAYTAYENPSHYDQWNSAPQCCFDHFLQWRHSRFRHGTMCGRHCRLENHESKFIRALAARLNAVFEFLRWRHSRFRRLAGEFASKFVPRVCERPP